MKKNCNRFELRTALKQMIKLLGKKQLLKLLWKTRALQFNMIWAGLRRKKIMKKEGFSVPMGIGLCATVRCNLSCEGCYARFYPRDDEMSRYVIERLISSAMGAGVSLFVITGGEPYIRPEMIEIYKKYRRALFITVTNGTLIDRDTVSDIAESGNVLTIVSIEGTAEQTDNRRGAGVYMKVVRCMSILKSSGIPFGFSAVLTGSTISTLGSYEFVKSMADAGCKVGFFNELIPLSPEEIHLVPDDNQRMRFKGNLDSIRKKLPLVLVNLHDDEYDETGRCMAVSDGGMHINAQGYVEPCPFAHFARENVKDQSFMDILRSPFLDAIRKHPTVLQQGKIGCSLVSNRDILEDIAVQTGAKPTDVH